MKKEIPARIVFLCDHCGREIDEEDIDVSININREHGDMSEKVVKSDYLSLHVCKLCHAKVVTQLSTIFPNSLTTGDNHADA